MSVPTVGLVVPPAAGKVPADAAVLYPHSPRFVARGLGLVDMAPHDYDRALGNLDDAVEGLLRAGASAVSLMGTSLSFYRGEAGHADVLRRLDSLTGGLPVSTMAAAVVRALRLLGARDIAVGSAYTGEVATRLAAFLTGEGFRVLAREELAITRIDALSGVGAERLGTLTASLLTAAPSADAVLLSCGGLDTLGVIPSLEHRYGLPVVASSPAGLWDAAGLVAPGVRGRHDSRLFATP
ncbi:hypothetical protein BAY61_10445 [Prauserella marina]|uniref:Arylmalonate decarboxylase n=1 Tax=Prauserella marina TaxID=530584 RepID=A0A222VN85_9PSEU|nr:hypothetical protein [Prauserella marina]ASR35344.1 hypothetical protein BAY61_10445 [Prauserella marina]PWV84866.1 arylmalonate decarboxylase [Prauserella marina]SDC11019.1 arylmalonate decarboxylase [Prauserella marina]